MQNERQLADVQQDPTQSLGQTVKEMGATPASERQPDCKIKIGLPFNAEHRPISRMNREDFKGVGDIGFG